MAKKIESQIIIKTAPEKIWNLLIDFENYPQWNSFITHIEGAIQTGNQLTVTIEPEKGKKMVFKPTLLSRIENRELSWLGKLGFKGIFDGKHQFKLIDNRNGTTTFIQSEYFSGLLVPFINLDATAVGFQRMNQNLKDLAEK